MIRIFNLLLCFTCVLGVAGYVYKSKPAGRMSNWRFTATGGLNSKNDKDGRRVPASRGDDDIIDVPEPPQTQGYIPTSIKDFKTADPTEGISLIKAPVANQMGNASLTFNMRLPEGRLGMAPDLEIQYSSDAGSSWLGYGWNMFTPAISIETRWGVPRFDAALETEMYTMNGQQLGSTNNHSDLGVRSSEKRFYPRVEGEFNKIIRHGGSPSTYWWEVTEKNGTRHFYGGRPGTGVVDSAVLKDDADNVTYWALVETRDLDNNFVHYLYKTVTDPGVESSTLPGKQLYLSQIFYTGSGTTDGPYKIEFFRDRDLGETKRKDITIDGRLGFKSVSADLLRKVKISFNNAIIRSYEFQYSEGAFYKTLLQSISELDDAEAVFYTHRFTYYDDINKQDYNPSDSSTNWNVPGDDLHGDISNPIPMFTGEATALGTSKASSAGGGAGVTVGSITGGLWSKKASVGGFFNYSEDDQEGLVAMIDINGDGLPDKVFKKDGNLHYRANLGAASHSFGEDRPITGVSDFNASSSKNIGGGVQVVPYAGYLGYDHTETNTTTTVYFSDFNGDGLMDICNDGVVYFNHLNDNGDPEFTVTSAPTPSPIFTGAVDPSFLQIDTALQSRQEKAFPLQDVVRMWEAPFTGAITITAPLQLIENLNQSGVVNTKKDGVRASIQLGNNNVLWNTVIDATDYSIKTPNNVTNVAINKGQRIYFRLQSRYNGQDDQVSWDPIIEYSAPQVPTSDHKVSSYYKASADYIMHGKSLVGASKNGTMMIDGVFKKNLTTDTVTLLVTQVRNNVSTIVFQRDYASAELADGNLPVIAGLTVLAADELHFSIVTKSYIDRSALSWIPHYAYVAYTDNTPVTTSTGAPTLQGYVVPDNSNYNTRLFAIPPFAPSKQDTVVLWPTVAGTGASGTLWFTIKGNDTIYARRQIVINGGVMSTAMDSIRLIRKVNEPLFMEYATDGMDLISNTQPPGVIVYRDSTVITGGIPKDSLILDTTLPANLYVNPDQEFLGPLFRGWGQFALKGDKGDGPIVEATLNLNELNSFPSDPNSFQDTTSLSGLQSPSNTNFVMLLPNAQKQSWIGYDTSVYVTSGNMSSSRLGMHDVSVDSMKAGASATAVSKKSRTVLDSFLGGVFLGPTGGSAGTSLATTTTTLDMMDMNGDLYPDVIDAESIQYTLPNGALGTVKIPQPIGETIDKGMSEGGSLGGDYSKATTANNIKVGSTAAENTAKHSIGLSGGVENNDDESVSSWVDINGDGLPDRVYNNGTVSLNLGYKFAQPEQWGLEGIDKGTSLSEGAGLGVDIDGGSIEGGFGMSRTTAKNSFGLNDVNGDGLPDQLFEDVNIISSGNTVRVRLNNGHGFGPAIEWKNFNEITCNTSVGEAVNGAFTVAVPIPILFIKFCVNPTANGGHGVARQQDMVMDIDGDGYADMLHSTKDDNLTASFSNIGRTNMLRMVKGPLGAVYTLDYERTGNTYSMPQSKWVMTNVTVFDGVKGDGVDTARYQLGYQGGYQDRKEREFYGFGTVTTHDLNTANHDKIYRSHVQQFLNTSYYTKGLLVSDWLEDSAGRRYTQTNNLYDPRIIGDDVQFPALKQTQKLIYEGAATPGESTVIQYDYDAFGNITRISDAGDGSQQDLMLTKIAYHDKDNIYVKSVPSSVEVTTAEGEKRKRTTTVNDQGDIVSISQFLADGTAAVTNIEYNSYGSVSKVTRPANYKGQRMSYSYEYDDIVHSYTTRVTDAFGSVTANTYNYRFGVLTGSINKNDEQTRYTLDNHGRVTSFTGPYELAAGKPYTIALSYHIDSAAASYGITKHYDPEYDTAISVVNFVDGLGRGIQVKKQVSLFKGKNVADDVRMVVSGKVLFDAFGRAARTFDPITEAIGQATDSFNITPGSMEAINTYDVQDRVTKTVLADGATSTNTYSIVDGMLNTVSTDALGKRVETLVDVRDRRRFVKEHGPDGIINTRLDYNALSELRMVTDNSGNAFSTSWDNMGRKLSAQHPDGGFTSFTYDLTGNLLRKTTAEIKKEIPDSGAIQYQYDYDRLTDIDYPRNYQNKVKYIYGAAGTGNKAGRVILQEDASGGQEFFYGLQGAIKKVIRTILINPVFSTTYVSEQEYDTWGRVKKITYPDGEEVRYHYNRSGGLLSMEGIKQGTTYGYVDQLGYDEYEQRTYMRYGNGTENLYKYDSLRRWLSQLQALTPAGQFMVNNSYRYDAEGNVLGVVNDVNGQSGQLGGYARQDYHYDDLYRIDSASGEYRGTKATTMYGVKVSYDNLYNIMHKTMHGATNGQDYDQLYTYGAAPHQATQIGANKYTYDANGNQLGYGDVEHFYDEENRLIALINKGVLNQYTYDADDNLSIRSSGGMQSIWVNGAPAGTVKHNDNYVAYVSPYLVCKSATFTKHYYIDGERIASKLGHGTFTNISFPQSGLTAGNVDYARRAGQMEQNRMDYYASLGVSPGPPTDKNFYAKPENSGIPAPVFVDSSSADSIPLGWPGNTATPPNGPPVFVGTIPSNDSVRAGYGFEDAGHLYENSQFFFHPDHVGSTTYVTNGQGDITQHMEYSPFGETFAEEHTGSYTTPYLFNAKERDDQTGYYMYGARYYDPVLSQWLNVLDPLGDQYPDDASGYGLVDQTEDHDDENYLYWNAGASAGKTLNPADNAGEGRGKVNKARDVKVQHKKATTVKKSEQLRYMHYKQKKFRKPMAMREKLTSLHGNVKKPFGKQGASGARKKYNGFFKMAPPKRRNAMQGGNGSK